MRLYLIFLCVFSGCEVIKCADILAIIPTPFYSHQATFRPLWRELAKRGHKITLITTDLMEENENITQIDFSGLYELKKYMEAGFTGKTGVFGRISAFASNIEKFFTYQMTHPALLKLYEDKKKFDLLFVELILPIYVSFSAKFDCPFIGLNTMDAPPHTHAAVGNAMNPVVYPYADLGLDGELSFFDRIKSIGFFLSQYGVFLPLARYYGNWYVRKYIGEDIPDTFEMVKNASAIFVNANPLFFPPRAVNPVTVNLGGGLHLTQPKPLPQDLQKYLDESKDGCIYVSFGTTVNSKYLTDEQKTVLVQVFQEMAPIRVLWKFDDADVAKDASNIEIRNWVPQQDVLRHPNIKLFVTQGGLQSVEEAVDSGVPMVGMPFFGDQFNNVLKMSKKQFGYSLHVKDMNRKSLNSALKEVLNNPKYKKNIDRYSAISKDQPMKGLEKAVWWTEYVLRHGGTEHLKSPSIDIPLYQYFFLDIFLLTAAIFSFIAFAFVKFYKCMYRFIIRRSIYHRTLKQN